MHELSNYLTLSALSEKLGISIQRSVRLIKACDVETYKLGGAVLTHKDNVETLRHGLKSRIIKRGRPVNG